MKIVDIREATKPIRSPIRNAYIDFSKMTLSLVAVITAVVCDDEPVVGYGLNSDGRYGQRAAPRSATTSGSIGTSGPWRAVNKAKIPKMQPRSCS